MSAEPVIRIEHLSHHFDGADVLRDISFEVSAGEIFGFIGPNGAGKTTTIRIMSTLLEPSRGRVVIDGIDVGLDPRGVRARIGYMADHAGVYERITVREYLDFFAAAYRLRSSVAVDAALELTDLNRLQDKLVFSMSKGQKQRLQLARILLHDPRVLILDEPASDLDPRARIEIRDLLMQLRDLGKTIFLSSHILSELADVCTSVGILENGRLVAVGPIGEIGARLEASRSEDRASPPKPPGRKVRIRVVGNPEGALALVEQFPGANHVQLVGGAIHTMVDGSDPAIAELVRHLVMNGVGVVAVEQDQRELERVFLEATKGEMQ